MTLREDYILIYLHPEQRERKRDGDNDLELLVIYRDCITHQLDAPVWVKKKNHISAPNEEWSEYVLEALGGILGQQKRYTHSTPTH